MPLAVSDPKLQDIECAGHDGRVQGTLQDFVHCVADVDPGYEE